MAKYEAENAAAKAAKATSEAHAQQYHATLNKARTGRNRIGWTWTGLEDIRKAAELDTASRDLFELRNEAADRPWRWIYGNPPSWPRDSTSGWHSAPTEKSSQLLRTRQTQFVFPYESAV